MQSGNCCSGDRHTWFWSAFSCTRVGCSDRRSFGRTSCRQKSSEQRARENGSVDALILIIPIIFLMIILISLFQYGMTLNRLHSSAILIGREIAREPEISHSPTRSQSLIEGHNLGVVDFHVMHFPIGNRVFIQLVLVGRTFNVGGFSITPSARSLTLQDSW